MNCVNKNDNNSIELVVVGTLAMTKIGYINIKKLPGSPSQYRIQKIALCGTAYILS